LIFCGECKIKATKVVKEVCYAKKIQNYIRNGTFLKLFPVDLPQSEATEFAAEREWQIFFGLMKYYSKIDAFAFAALQLSSCVTFLMPPHIHWLGFRHPILEETFQCPVQCTPCNAAHRRDLGCPRQSPRAQFHLK
jgi:hypothetical protein